MLLPSDYQQTRGEKKESSAISIQHISREELRGTSQAMAKLAVALVR